MISPQLAYLLGMIAGAAVALAAVYFPIELGKVRRWP